MTNWKFPKLVGLVLGAAAITASPAFASDKGELLRDGNKVVDDLRHDPAFAQAARMISTARAVYIVPKLVKGGFIVGAEGGNGQQASGHEELGAEPARTGAAGTRHIYLRKNRQLKSPIQTMSTKCQ